MSLGNSGSSLYEVLHNRKRFLRRSQRDRLFLYSSLDLPLTNVVLKYKVVIRGYNTIKNQKSNVLSETVLKNYN